MPMSSRAHGVCCHLARHTMRRQVCTHAEVKTAPESHGESLSPRLLPDDARISESMTHKVDIHSSRGPVNVMNAVNMPHHCAVAGLSGAAQCIRDSRLVAQRKNDMLTGTSHRVVVIRKARESLTHLVASWCQCVRRGRVPCTCVLHSVVPHGANTPLPSVTRTAERHDARLTLIVAMLLLLPSAK